MPGSAPFAPISRRTLAATSHSANVGRASICCGTTIRGHRHEPHGTLSLVSQDSDKLQAGKRIAEDFVKDVYFAKALEDRGLAHPEQERPEEQPEDSEQPEDLLPHRQPNDPR